MAGADPYTLKDGIVLINKLGITDENLWRKVESSKTMNRITELVQNPIEGNFDYNHLQKIHGYIFQDMYNWAGKERTCVIAKQDIYCLPQYIESYSKPFYDNLKKENYLKGLNIERFGKKAAQYMGDIYSVHAFREGNTRSTCEFMRELAQNAGYKLDFSNVSHDQLRDAYFASVRGQYDQLEKVMQTSLSPLENSHKLKRNAIDKIMNYSNLNNLKITPEMEYLNQAQKIIKGNNRWPGEEADFKIVENMMKHRYEKPEIINAVQNFSPEAIDEMICYSRDYANKIVNRFELEKTITKGIDR